MDDFAGNQVYFCEYIHFSLMHRCTWTWKGTIYHEQTIHWPHSFQLTQCVMISSHFHNLKHITKNLQKSTLSAHLLIHRHISTQKVVDHGTPLFPVVLDICKICFFSISHNPFSCRPFIQAGWFLLPDCLQYVLGVLHYPNPPFSYCGLENLFVSHFKYKCPYCLQTLNSLSLTHMFTSWHFM